MVVFRAEPGRLIALDLNTGKKSWMFRADDMIRSTPTMAAGVICFGSDDGYVYALEIAPALSAVTGRQPNQAKN